MPAVRVRPLGRPVDAVVAVPGSKSIANRALVCAALADGPSALRGVPDGDDSAAMLDCLARAGRRRSAVTTMARSWWTATGRRACDPVR